MGDPMRAETKERIGKITIEPEVLLTIIRLTVLDVPGVAHLCSHWSGGVGRFFAPRRLVEGIHVEVQDNAVTVDLHVVAYPSDNLLGLARTIQQEVARAILELVGMSVQAVNVHIEDILFSQPEAERP